MSRFSPFDWPRLLLIPTLVAALGWLAAAAVAADDPAYQLRPLDLVRIQVFGQPDLEREVRVTQDLTIVLPLIGTIDVRGRSVRDVEHLVTGLFRADYLVNPHVNVSIIEYAPRSVNVFGAVNSPAAILLPPEKDYSLLDAIARAGGFSRLANRNRISLTRLGADGKPQNFVINADELMVGDTANRWLLRDGDILYVPERVL